MGVKRAPRAGRPPANSSPLATEDALRAALAAFAARGYDGCSVQQLARDLGVSHNLLNQRFGTKDDLWRAAVDWGFDRMRAALAGAGIPPDTGDAVERLRSLVVCYVRAAAAVPDVARLLAVEGATDGPRLRYAFERHIAPVLVPLRRVVTQLEAEGRARPVPFRTLCFLIHGGAVAPFAQAAASMLIEPTDPFDPDAVEEHARVVADLLLAVLRPIPEPVGPT